MVEFWASVGLACIDEVFLGKLKKNAPGTIEEYSFRLSRFELAELERMVGNPKVQECMERLIGVIRCKPPRMCLSMPPPSGEYDQFKEAHESAIEAYLKELRKDESQH